MTKTKVVTHQMQFGIIDICPDCEHTHGLPDMGAYYGVQHGLDDGYCDHPRHTGPGRTPAEKDLERMYREFRHNALL